MDSCRIRWGRVQDRAGDTLGADQLDRLIGWTQRQLSIANETI